MNAPNIAAPQIARACILAPRIVTPSLSTLSYVERMALYTYSSIFINPMVYAISHFVNWPSHVYR